MLSDGRLKRLHDLINFCIALQINSKNWSKNGRPEILWQPLEIYLRKGKQKRKIDEPRSNHKVEVHSSDCEKTQSDSFD